MLFLNKLQQNCQTFTDKTAVEFINPDIAAPERITYAQLETIIQQTMIYLHTLGIQPGDRVAMQLPKCLPFLYLHLAIMRMGAITLPLNPGYPASELSYFLTDADAHLFFADVATQSTLTPIVETILTIEQTIFLETTSASFLAHINQTNNQPLFTPPLPANPAQIALLVYTSGTTGRPKGAQLTHGNLTANLDGLQTAWGWQHDDILLHVLPIFHLHGLLVALHGALHAGATTLMMPKFETQPALDLLTQRRCTVLMAVPTIHKRLLDFPDATSYDLSHMRLLTSGSDRLPEDFFIKFQETFGHTLLERYGMTETGMNISNPLHGERRVGSVGLPLPTVEVRIVDQETEKPLPDNEVGEVQIRGPHVFSGYWRDPQKTKDAFTNDGWLRTGDLGLRESDGYFTLKGRSKDLIITGGLNVYPPEVELVLTEHSLVAASAVVGLPNEEWGERVVAVIIPVAVQDVAELNADEAAKQAIIEHCRQHLARYKAPRDVIFVDDLPRNAIGKVQKAELRSQLVI
ncbi:MAG: AMP-binding protein [Chloroflexota bacterium]